MIGWWNVAALLGMVLATALALLWFEHNDDDDDRED